jgi:eukaryotic-like serine/threonine-protein kinase
VRPKGRNGVDRSGGTWAALSLAVRPAAAIPPALFALLVVLTSAGAGADQTGRVVRLQTRDGVRRFQLDRKLGQGWWSEVYSARSLDGGGPVAVKLMLDDRRREGHDDARSLKDELALNRAQHGTLVKMHGLADVEGSGSGRKALVMDLVEGKPLAPSWWEDGQARPAGKSVRIIMQVLRAARAMHATGLRHNDIHPGNILIHDERSDTVKLVDLANATPIGGSSPLGSPWHSAPEVMKRGPTENQVRTDVFSAGAVLAFLLTGHQPDPNKPQLRDLIPHLTTQVGGQAVTLRQIVDKAMAKEPSARYQSAQEMIDALRPFSAL